MDQHRAPHEFVLNRRLISGQLPDKLFSGVISNTIPNLYLYVIRHVKKKQN